MLRVLRHRYPSPPSPRSRTDLGQRRSLQKHQYVCAIAFARGLARVSGCSPPTFMLPLDACRKQVPITDKPARSKVCLKVGPHHGTMVSVFADIAPEPRGRPFCLQVPLEKGYSQVDWLKLSKSGADLNGLSGGSLRRDITLEEVGSSPACYPECAVHTSWTRPGLTRPSWRPALLALVCPAGKAMHGYRLPPARAPSPVPLRVHVMTR